MLAGLFRLSLLLAAPLAVFANPHGSAHNNRHVEIARRQGGDVQLHKRFSSARWTFYDVGLGACGKVNVASDFIVALNSDQFGGGFPGPNCFKTITMTYNGKTTSATIMDECPGCPYGGLDLSRGLFNFFAPESAGVLSGTWSFGGDSGGDDTPAPTKPPAPKPTTTKKISIWTPDPTTFWTPDPTTSTTKEKSTTSTSTTHTSSSTSTSHSSSAPTTSLKHTTSSTSTSTSATPTATPPSTTGNALAGLNQIFLQLGVLVVAAV